MCFAQFELLNLRICFVQHVVSLPSTMMRELVSSPLIFQRLVLARDRESTIQLGGRKREIER